jgi:hypothetical protein
MEFTKKGVVITWTSNEGIWDGDQFSGYLKDHPYEFSYMIYDSGRKMEVIYLSSAQALHFPYSTIEISDSKDKIITIRYDDRKEVLMRKK